MSLNCVEIEEIIKTLPTRGMIRKFFQPDNHTLILNIFDEESEYYLAINIRDKYNRLYLTTKKESGTSILRFGQLLNGSFGMCKLLKLYQYHYARIVILELDNGNGLHYLIFRLWSSGSNIILTDDEYFVVDCLRRMPKRSEWPGEEFMLPEKKDVDLSRFPIREIFTGNDINKAVREYYSKLVIAEDFNKKHRQILQILNKEENVIGKALDKIDYNLREDREDTYRYYGELLKMNMHAIKKGMKHFEAHDYETDKPISIPIAEDLSPSDNVKRYFEKYKKIKTGRIKWEEEKERTEQTYENILELIEQCNAITDLKTLTHFEGRLFRLTRSLRKKSIKKKPETKKELPGRKFTLDDGFKAFVSRSAKEADQILKIIAKGNDYWFHIRDEAGSHIIVKSQKNKELTEKARLEAATLALFYSKAKGEADGDIYFTRVKYLHRSKGGPAGLVFPTQEKNIKVIYKEEIIKEIFNRS